MRTDLIYAKLVLVDLDPLGNWILETISIQEDVSVLSGAWVLGRNDGHSVQHILSDRLILAMNPETSTAITSLGFESPATVDAFLTEARNSAKATRLAFELHVAEGMKGRDKLVEPALTDWPEPFTLSRAHEVLNSIGKQAFPSSTPSNFRNTLAASNMLKFLIDGWLSDERERTTRPYLNLVPNFVRLLPNVWASHIA